MLTFIGLIWLGLGISISLNRIAKAIENQNEDGKTKRNKEH